MAQNNNTIKNCKECGHPILIGSDDICQLCKDKKTREQYSKLVKAEKHINKDSGWLKEYSAWTTIMAIPVVIFLLVIFFYVLSLITNKS